MALTAAQKVETNRLGADRVLDKDHTGSQAIDLKKLEKRTVPQLKARVNILGVSDKVNFAPENDYTAQEQAYIEAGITQNKWMIAFPKVLERAAILEAEGLTPAAIVEILRGN